MSLYELKNIVHRYNGKPVLTIREKSIPHNTIIGLAGPNGGGKSTLLRLLGFVERPSEGQIILDGKKAEPFSLNVRKRVTLLPQDSHLLKRSVYRNLAYGLRLQGNPNNEKQRIEQALEWVGLKADAFSRRPWYALSGGEARRVALAARLVLKPNVLLLDEPTTSVDALSAVQMKTAVLQAHQLWRTTLIVASHDMEWLQDISHCVLYLYHGRILNSGNPTLLFGPWQKNAAGHACKKLSDDQVFNAGEPPVETEGALAAIDSDHLHIAVSEQSLPEACYRLKGTLLRLSFDRAADRINAAVVVADTTFSVYLTPDRMRATPLMPGRKVWIGYDPRKITWHC